MCIRDSFRPTPIRRTYIFVYYWVFRSVLSRLVWFSSVSTKPSYWLGETSLKWPSFTTFSWLIFVNYPIHTWFSDCLSGIVTVVLVVTLLFRPLLKFMFTYLLTYFYVDHVAPSNVISKLIYLPSPASPFSHPATPAPPTWACLNLCAIQIL